MNLLCRSGPWIGFGALVLATGCASSLPAPQPVEGEYTLLVEVEGATCCEGALHVALYNHEDYWLEDGGMVRGQVTPVTGSRQTVEFAGLPAGAYAVAAFQDLNQNAEFDFLLGIVPREPYGFSNDGAGLRPPSFASASASVPVPEIERIRVVLREAPL